MEGETIVIGDLYTHILYLLIYARCGICGDPWDARIREHEAPGGKYATGVITRNYSPGEQVLVTSDITANHLVRT